jgi:hypothetical protein
VSQARPTTYKPDRRGNRLQDWRFETLGQRWLLLLRGADDIAKHVVAGCPGTRRVNLQWRHREYWTHRFLLAEPPTSDLEEFLKLLEKTLVLCVRDGIDGALALDFYSRPCESDSEQLEYTETGNLVRRIKSYGYVEPVDLTAAGVALSTSLKEVVAKHPWLRSATRLLPVPGHDSRAKQTSGGVRIGHTLSRMLGLDLIKVGTRHEFRLAAKSMTSEQRASLIDEFIIEDDLTGDTVLIVDDVYHTGWTMAGVAKAARQAGALTVLGIVPARNLRLDV